MEGPIISATANAIDIMASPDKFQVDAHTLTPTRAEFQTLPPRQREISNPSQRKDGGQEFRGHCGAGRSNLAVSKRIVHGTGVSVASRPVGKSMIFLSTRCLSEQIE